MKMSSFSPIWLKEVDFTIDEAFLYVVWKLLELLQCHNIRAGCLGDCLYSKTPFIVQFSLLSHVRCPGPVEKELLELKYGIGHDVELWLYFIDLQGGH